MNPTVLLYLLATVGAFALADAQNLGTNNNQQFNLIQSLKDMRRKVVNVMIFNIEDMMQMNGVIMYTHKAARQMLNSMVLTETNNTHVTVNNSIAEGKNVEHCIDLAENELKKTKLFIESRFSLCVNASYRQLLDSFQISNRILKDGHQIIAFMRNVLAICNRQVFRIECCRARECKTCKAFLECFNEKYDWHPKYRNMVDKQIIHKVVTCIGKHANEGAKDIGKVESITKSCIEGAE